MLDDKKKDLKNGIQKLNDDDTAQVSGGLTRVTDASSFFKRNRVSTTCNRCGAKQTIKIDPKDIMTRSWSGGEHYLWAELYWACKQCGTDNKAYIRRDNDKWNGYNYFD